MVCRVISNLSNCLLESLIAFAISGKIYFKRSSTAQNLRQKYPNNVFWTSSPSSSFSLSPIAAWFCLLRLMRGIRKTSPPIRSAANYGPCTSYLMTIGRDRQGGSSYPFSVRAPVLISSMNMGWNLNLAARYVFGSCPKTRMSYYSPGWCTTATTQRQRLSPGKYWPVVINHCYFRG